MVATHADPGAAPYVMPWYLKIIIEVVTMNVCALDLWNHVQIVSSWVDVLPIY